MEKTIPDLIKSNEDVSEVLRTLLATPHITVSELSTLQFFRSLWEQIAEQNREIFFRAGENSGILFGNQAMEVWIKVNKIPMNDEMVVRLLCSYHTAAKWGVFTCQKFSPQHVEIKVESSFLVDESVRNKHQYCCFLEGYLLGFLWIAIRDRHRWFKVAYSAIPQNALLKPQRISEKVDGDACLFSLEFMPEELSPAFDILFLAKEKFREEAYLESLTHTRTALEAGFKTKVGIPISTRVSFFSLLNGYRRAVIPHDILDYQRIGRLYERAGVIIHDVGLVVQSNKAWQGLLEADQILKTLDSFIIGKRYKQRICVETGQDYSSTKDDSKT